MFRKHLIFVDYYFLRYREPVVKSPPEPTRVKSPEGIIRSPDPINWTVPLDTTKTFSVTQSVKDGGETLFFKYFWTIFYFKVIAVSLEMFLNVAYVKANH